MNRKLLVVLVVLVSLLVIAVPVSAGLRFCSGDPVFKVGGEKVEVIVELAPYEIKDAIRPGNPVQVLLTAPKGTPAKVMRVNGEFPEVAYAVEGPGRQVMVGVTVPDIDTFQALRVSVYRDGQLVRQKEVRTRYLVLAFPW